MDVIEQIVAASGAEECECGCGKVTTRVVRRLREQDRGDAEKLRWAETSVGPMRVAVHLLPGHESERYVDESEH